MDHQVAAKIGRSLSIALECSYYVSPEDPGLSYQELVEVAGQLGIKPGQVDDALQLARTKPLQNRRLGPDPQTTLNWISPVLAELPDFISDRAGDFWTATLMEAADEVGAARAAITEESTIARAESAGIPRKDMSIYLAVEVAIGRVVQKDGVISLPRGHNSWVGRSVQRQNNPVLNSQKSDREQIRGIVADIVARRTDGRASHIDAWEAFADRLASLGYSNFGLWWTQLREECRRSDPQTAPVSALVLSAALVEGCLTFVVRYGKDRGLGIFGSRTFDGPSTRWRLDDLIGGAASGPTPILDQTTRQRADALCSTRQRIHAGRLLSDLPQPIPDLRPEEAREAQDTAKRVVRSVLDWLDAHP